MAIPVHTAAPARLYAEAIAASLATVALSWVLRDSLAGTRLLLFWVMSVAVAVLPVPPFVELTSGSRV